MIEGVGQGPGMYVWTGKKWLMKEGWREKVASGVAGDPDVMTDKKWRKMSRTDRFLWLEANRIQAAKLSKWEAIAWVVVPLLIGIALVGFAIYMGP